VSVRALVGRDDVAPIAREQEGRANDGGDRDRRALLLGRVAAYGSLQLGSGVICQEPLAAFDTACATLRRPVRCRGPSRAIERVSSQSQRASERETRHPVRTIDIAALECNRERRGDQLQLSQQSQGTERLRATEHLGELDVDAREGDRVAEQGSHVRLSDGGAQLRRQREAQLARQPDTSKRTQRIVRERISCILGRT